MNDFHFLIHHHLLCLIILRNFGCSKDRVIFLLAKILCHILSPPFLSFPLVVLLLLPPLVLVIVVHIIVLLLLLEDHMVMPIFQLFAVGCPVIVLSTGPVYHQ